MCHTLHPYYAGNDKLDTQSLQHAVRSALKAPIAHSPSEEAVQCQYNKRWRVKYKNVDMDVQQRGGKECVKGERGRLGGGLFMNSRQ